MLNGRYTECYECSTVTAIEDSPEDPTEPWCGNCDSQGEDPGLGQLIDVTDCPAPEDCHDENHHHGTNKHHTPAEV